MARVVLAMSGGVDSSVAAHLLKEAGHEVIGIFMRHGEESSEVCKVDSSTDTALPVLGGLASGRADHKQGCCTASDAADARRVAAAMEIPFYALDLQADFRRIVDYFVDDYLVGRTPNPCIKCNHWIKFGRLFDYADGVDADYVATGHYARMIDGQLHRGLDGNKDQSYALFGIRGDRLGRMMLPVGDFEKPEIRRIAESLDLGVARKKDSQEICFVTQGHHSDFVKARRPELAGTTAGEMVTLDGTVVGTHQGYEAFTIGQRKKLGVALGVPHFVVRIEPDTRRVVLATKEHLGSQTLLAKEANWLTDDLSGELSVQIRYNGSPHPAIVHLDPSERDSFRVQFESPVDAVAPGQAAVVYRGTQVIGGGWIEHSGEDLQCFAGGDV
ncbi:tRNA 2-thiouridine(34) synthase MnmA [Roseiconus lacunae]|uniref:tRNA-specific 2-thiouridylase MnmA n=1 Tax=Roseiconus lacunae TaxID=2605694 RepID=A0ABT7PN31_9BACT|nr:tRNA 2-thiouridine(34) synthase MnmA [Roseiconus lacunae]MCD0463278.1 tRNA 2-thiouridine(34) synthase MnmA [Roseiconus lacunae]MDM4017904.1 tRNA 2-thiouridine(34) synthase MnmA [Roseiconus lacunae]WRQ52521.1 tRNA 2-thiouridine(34) synthase MnmA [Stieleria sp. HD01]